MEYTKQMELAGRIAAKRLSKKAFDLYARLKPFKLYEYETDEGLRYAYKGLIGDQNDLTFSGLEYILEEVYRLMIEET